LVTVAVGARLLAYSLPTSAAPGDTVTLAVRWKVVETADGERLRADAGEDYTWFVHLIDDSHLVRAQDDWLGLPTWQWREGDEVLSWFRLPIAADAPCGTLHVEMGMYSRPSGSRAALQVVDRSGAMPRDDDRVVFGDLRLCP
jgi:hypothetical protein